MSNDLKSITESARVNPRATNYYRRKAEKRKDLKDKRDLLFERYLKQPMNTRMALEIKLIDDQLAEDAKPNPGKPRKTFHNRPK